MNLVYQMFDPLSLSQSGVMSCTVTTVFMFIPIAVSDVYALLFFFFDFMSGIQASHAIKGFLSLSTRLSVIIISV